MDVRREESVFAGTSTGADSLASPISEIGKDREDQKKRDPSGSHQAGVSDGTRSFRFDAGHRSDRSHDGGKGKPEEPSHRA